MAVSKKEPVRSVRGKTRKNPSATEIRKAEQKVMHLRKEEYRLLIQRDELKKKIRDETAWLKDLNSSLENTERQLRDNDAELKKYTADLKRRGITGAMINMVL